MPVASNSRASSCDCLAHTYGNAADHGERVRRYPSDTTDAEWAQARVTLPTPGWLEGRGGQPEAYCHRTMLDAIHYLVDNGIKWRAMPADFPPWDHVYAFFRRWRDLGLVKEFHDRLRSWVRSRAGRDAEPSAGVIDSQSVKADAVVGADSRGFDGGKLINGRKRHVVVDTLGLLLAVTVTPADIGDRTAAKALLAQVADAHHLLDLIWADGGYTDGLIEDCFTALVLAGLAPAAQGRRHPRPRSAAHGHRPGQPQARVLVPLAEAVAAMERGEHPSRLVHQFGTDGSPVEQVDDDAEEDGEL
ncbi:IS5 family transposase [Kitasatospora sp. HPMI-4]|uniref:IS5 family transposase n=1 Tax=Kitasatospora sp. HPMI-4 TaxID=3448443 RepID=UPI003F1C317E